MAAALVVGAIGFTILEPVQVLARSDLAPGYSLVAADGTAVTSEMARGRITIYGFATLDCQAECQADMDSMARVAERLAATDLGPVDWALTTVVIDPVDDPGRLADFAERIEAGESLGERRQVVGGDAATIERVVGRGFKRFTGDAEMAPDLGFVLVDPAGVIRGDYRFKTIQPDTDKLVDHVTILANEINRSKGMMSVAFEAAHLFRCYP